jgi:hypothetical protein
VKEVLKPAPLTKMIYKAEGFTYLTEAQYKSQTVPGPTKYNPNYDFVKKKSFGFKLREEPVIERKIKKTPHFL